MDGAGAAYLFTFGNSTWQQQAYIKASNANVRDFFGAAVALSTDGSTLAVGAYYESSAAQGINGDETNNSIENAGAAYVFMRSNNRWRQQAYVKARNNGTQDWFGSTIALSDDGSTLAVGAWGEDSTARGINGDGTDNSMETAGAVYLY
jgi:hypothetical protein